jgi:mannosyltransferase OCH1-like enzyme
MVPHRLGAPLCRVAIIAAVALLIPRVFHQVWVGGAQFPAEFSRYQQTWLDHHPDWELRLWTEGNLPDGLRRPEAYERLRSPVERCDILRLELPLRFGGVYLDCDFECLRSIELLIDELDFFVGDTEDGRVNHAIMGAVAGHPILIRALDEIRPREFFGYDKESTGPLFFDRLMKEFPDAKAFDKSVFYAPEAEAREHSGYAIHHEAISWKDADELRRDLGKARANASKARKQADEWRAKYMDAEAKLRRLRRPLAPLLKVRRLTKRR